MADTANLHFPILDDIARDLAGDVNFPTCLDAAVLVRNTLKDPFAELAQVAKVISVEPLICSKLLRMANSIAYNPYGREVTDVATAVSRLGFDVVRTTSLAVALDQMLKSRNLRAYEPLAKQVWEHSIQVAAIARVLARRLGRVNPDEALLAGLVHDIGIFYLLYRAADYPVYQKDPEAVQALLVGWHESIGENLLHALGMPATIIDAVRDHDQPGNVETPCTVKDMIYFANLLASRDATEIPGTPLAPDTPRQQQDRERYADLLAEAADDIAQLQHALAG